MTITRIGQLTAEMNTLLDVNLYGGGANNVSIATAQYKTGERSYALGASSDPFGIACDTRTLRTGFWLRHHGATSSPTVLLLQISTTAIKVRWNASANTFDVLTGYDRESYSWMVKDSVSAGTFSTIDTWRHIGACVDYQYTSGDGYFSFYVDGVLLSTHVGGVNGIAIYPEYSTSLRTETITGVFAAGYQGAGAWTTTTYVDDFYVDDMTSEAAAVVPAKRFLFSLASADGTTSQWTPLSSTNISNVDDAVSSEHDGDTTYVKALAADLVDLYDHTGVSVPVDHAIVAAIPIAIARKTDATDCQMSLKAYDGANTTTSTAQTMTTAYGAIFARMALQPDGSGWNEADFNACEFGFESEGTFA